MRYQYKCWVGLLPGTQAPAALGQPLVHKPESFADCFNAGQTPLDQRL